jgi:SAM-dependent methyltransferase
MSFKDHFSGHAAAYASARPGYPADLFEILAGLPARRRLAWDAGTGNGQAAVRLAEQFEKVIATDPSAPQLAHAAPHPRVEYRVGPAESSGLAPGSVDLVTAAQAFHWFDFGRFFAEVERVLAPGGALAVWTYNLVRFTPEIDALIDHLAYDLVGTYWPPERRWVDQEYRSIPFPFAEVEIPPLRHEESWDLARLVSYLRTWSSAQRYSKETGTDAVALIGDDLEAAWGDPSQVRTAVWPIFLRAGRPGTAGAART